MIKARRIIKSPPKPRPKPRRHKTDRQKQEAKLDMMWSDYIRLRAMKTTGGCQRCLAPKESFLRLQAAHLFSRKHHTTRWDTQVGVGICGACHMWIDSHAEDKIAFATKILGEEEYERLYVLSNMTTKQSPVDLTLKEIELKELLKEV
jgi:hypothetical protein